MNMSDIADCLCGHHVLLANAKIYKLYHQEYNTGGNYNKKLLLNLKLLFFI